MICNGVVGCCSDAAPAGNVGDELGLMRFQVFHGAYATGAAVTGLIRLSAAIRSTDVE